MSFCSFILHQLDAGNGPREVGSYNTDATWGVSESLGRGRPPTNQNICLGFVFFFANENEVPIPSGIFF